MTQREQILAGLEPLIQKAERMDLLLRARAFGHDELIFTPKELRAYHQKGQYIWGAVNWTLEEPRIVINSLERDIKKAEEKLATFKQRMKDNE